MPTAVPASTQIPHSNWYQVLIPEESKEIHADTQKAKELSGFYQLHRGSSLFFCLCHAGCSALFF